MHFAGISAKRRTTMRARIEDRASLPDRQDIAVAEDPRNLEVVNSTECSAMLTSHVDIAFHKDVHKEVIEIGIVLMPLIGWGTMNSKQEGLLPV